MAFRKSKSRQMGYSRKTGDSDADERKRLAVRRTIETGRTTLVRKLGLYSGHVGQSRSVNKEVFL